MATRGNQAPAIRIHGHYEVCQSFKVFCEEAAMWVLIPAAMGSNPAHPRGAEVSQVRIEVQQTLSIYSGKSLRIARASGVAGQYEPDQGPALADDDVVYPHQWLYASATKDPIQEAVLDADWDTLVVAAPDDPPTPDGPLRADVLVYVVELEQWFDIVVPQQPDQVSFARRSVNLLEKRILAHLGHATTRVRSDAMRIIRCEGISDSTKGFAIPPMLKGNTLIADRSWYLASTDPTTYVGYTARWEPMLEPQHYLDALGAGGGAQHIRDVSDPVGSPN